VKRLRELLAFTNSRINASSLKLLFTDRALRNIELLVETIDDL